ncbi:hypothetical protein EGM51_12005 [Verrucomicrobia bacterium S94]|nr:hypothetical protein EGM51_12005 [Verrucomicrobia bacterium S94]
MNIKTGASLIFFSGSIVCAGVAQQAFFSQMQTHRIASADRIIWTQEGPGNSGMCDLVRYHPVLPDTAFLSPDMGGNYQTDNNGHSWFDARNYDGDSGFGRQREVWYSHSNTDVGLALGGSHLRVTTDRGQSWAIVLNCPWYELDSDGTDRSSWKSKVSAVTIDPGDHNVWYVGAGNHRHGQLWSSSMKEATAANPQGDSSEISGKIWKTVDGGTHWAEVSNGIDPAAQFCRIQVNPNNSQQIFAASNYGLYRSDNGGDSWINIGSGKLPNNTVISLDLYDDGNGSTVVYVIDQVRYFPSGSTTTNSGGVYRSIDLGETWQQINGNLYLDINRLGWIVGDGYYNYLAKWFETDKAVVQSLYPDKPVDALQPVQLLRVDPSAPDTVYIGLGDPQGLLASFGMGPLWKTSDGGGTWMMVTRGYGPAFANDAEFWSARGNPVNQNMVWNHEPFNQQWGSSYPQRTMRSFDVNSRGDVMLISGHCTLVSTNRAETFEQIDEFYTPAGNLVGRGNSNLPGESMKQDPRLRPGELYLGSGEHRLWKTTLDDMNGRVAMKQLPTMDTVSAIALHPNDTDTVFVTSYRQAHANEIWRSTDGGSTFSKWGDATAATYQMETRSLLIDPVNPQYFYFGIRRRAASDWDKEGGFYYSSDGGRTFAPRNIGLPANPRVNKIEWDPRDPTYQSMFIAVEGAAFDVPEASNGGLYHSVNRGQTWTEITIDPEVDGVNEVKIDQSGRIWITAGYRNSNTGGLWYSDDYGITWEKTFVSPLTECVDVSPFDSNLVVVTVGNLQKNPGLYLSEDRGRTWTKNNRSVSINWRIRDVEFSIHDPTTLWLACVGAGFFKGTYIPYQTVHFSDMQDLGDVAAAGAITQVGGSTIISASGSDLWNTADEGFFASQSWSGDCDIRVRVAEVESVNEWSKGGVMIRETQDADAANVAVIVRPDGRVSMQWRISAGAASSYVGTVGDSGSIKSVRLIRSGDRFSGYYSTDGFSWTLIAEQTVSMTADVFAGLAVTSHNDGQLCEAVFNNAVIQNPPSDRLTGRISGSNLVLQWDSTSIAENYTLYSCTNLAEAEWISVSNYPGVDASLTFSEKMDRSQRFFKVERN